MQNRFAFGHMFGDCHFAEPSATDDWLDVLQTFPQWFESQTLDDIRGTLARDLREKGSVSLGWTDDHVLRFVTADRKMVRLILGRSDDFVLTELCRDIDSVATGDWEPIRNELRAGECIQRLYNVRFRLSEVITPGAQLVMQNVA